MSEVLHILHLEDDPLDGELVQAELQRAGFAVELERVDTLPDLRQGLENPLCRLILSDYTMPGLDPLEALRLARQLRPEVPFIFLSGTLGEDVAIETLKQGATDYVLKQRLARLGPAVRRALQEAREQARRKQAEQAVRESESRFRQLAEALPQLVWTARADGRVDYLNGRWREFTGQTPAPLIQDWSWQSLIHPEDRERALTAWRDAVRLGQPYEIEHRLLRHDGVYRWHIVRGVPVREEGGAIRQWFGTCTDIDDQKRAQTELQEAAHRKDDFLAMLGHELRNPLGPMRNGVRLLERSPAQDMLSRRAREMIQRQVLHLSRMLDDLLDVSRFARGKITLQKEPVDLTEIVRTVVEDNRETVENSALILRLCLPNQPTWVEADRTRVTQIVGNLLINASKFTDPGGQVSVSLRQDARTQTAVISVTDSGIGIEPADLTYIFEPFAQVRKSVERGIGLGLGLSLVRGLTELHGGKVEAHSLGQGRGAEFVVTLPRGVAPDKPKTAEQNVLHDTAARSVLIIEDNLDAAESLRMILELVGHQVFEAHSGPEGVEMAQRKHPQVVLCDIGLPGFDGYEVVRRLRADPVLVGTYIVAMTGFGQDEDRRRAKEVGFDVHLTKPVEPAYLEKLLASFGKTTGVIRTAYAEN